MQLLEELVSELQLTDPVSSGVTHMDNPPYYRITSSCKIPSVTSGKKSLKTDPLVSEEKLYLTVQLSGPLLSTASGNPKAIVSPVWGPTWQDFVNLTEVKLDRERVLSIIEGNRLTHTCVEVEYRFIYPHTTSIFKISIINILNIEKAYLLTYSVISYYNYLGIYDT